MRFNHLTKFEGRYYKAGEDVPIEVEFSKEVIVNDEKETETETEVVEIKVDFSEMTLKQLKEYAKNNGIEITKTSKADVLDEILQKQ